MHTAHLIPPQSVKLSVALKIGPAVKKIYENPNNGLLSLEMSFNTTTDRKKSKKRKNKSPHKADSP